jgi:nucleoporin-like protein 2
MNRRQELCRNFQRGRYAMPPVPSRHSIPSCWLLSLSFNFVLVGCSCKYGAQCRFVHASSQQQQQPKSNPFGFGTGSKQQPQPSSNPFGFGTGNRQQQPQPSSNPFGFGTGSKQHQQPPFGSQFQQQQQQKLNPFGFGVQGGAAQSRNAPGPAKVCVPVGGMELVLTTHSQLKGLLI